MAQQPAGEAIVVIDNDGVFVSANEEAVRRLGMEASSILEKRIWEVVLSVTEDAWKLTWQNLLESGTTNIECISPFVATALDIRLSAFKVSEKSYAVGVLLEKVGGAASDPVAPLSDPDQRCRSIIENSSDITYTLDTEGRLTYVSPQIVALGGKVAEAIGRHLRDLVNAKDAKAVLRHAHQTLRGEKTEPIVFRLPTVGEREIWVEQRSSPLRDASGNVIGVIGTMHNISERHLAMERLAESERRFRAFVENSPDIIIEVQRSGKLTYVSPQIERYGVSLDEVIGKNIFRFIAPEMWAKTLADFVRFARQPAGYEPSVESCLMNAKGERYMFEIQGRKQVAEDGRPWALLGIMRNIDARKKLEASERRLAEITGRLNIGICRVVSKGASWEVEANEALVRLLEADSKEQLLHVNISDMYVDPDARKRYLEKLQHEGQVDNEEILLRTFKGNNIWCAMTIRSLTGSDGQPYFEGFMIDVTGRRLAEEAANSSRRRTEEILAGVSLGVYRRTTGPEGKIIEANSAIVKMFEAESPEAVLGAPYRQFYANESDLPIIAKQLQSTGRINNVELEMKTLKGRKFWVSASGVIRHDDEGRAVFDGIMEEITEQHLTAQMIKRRIDLERVVASISRDFINVSEKYFPESLQEAIKSVNQAVGIDEGHLVTLAVDRRVNMSDHPADINLKTTSDAATVEWKWWIEKIAMGQTIRVDDVRAMPADASVEQSELAKLGIKSVLALPLLARGRPTAFLCFETRHSEHVWSDEEVYILTLFAEIVANTKDRFRALEVASEADKMRNKFVQIVSHQLRTPLTAIRWNLETLLNQELGPLQPAQQEVLRIAYERHVETINRLGEMLMALDIQEQRIRLNREEYPLEVLWSSVYADMTRFAKSKGITIQYLAPTQPLAPVEIDVEKMRLVLEALAHNAIDYTSGGGSITVQIKPNGSRIHFEITDTGIGVPPSEQPRLFSRFFRASNASQMKQDASGLGLSIAKYYVEQHGGRIGFASEEGKGSTFWFEVPMK